MIFWNVSSDNVSITVGGKFAKAGEPIDIPNHLMGDAARLIRSGRLSTQEPVAPAPVQPEPTASAESDSSTATEGRKKRA